MDESRNITDAIIKAFMVGKTAKQGNSRTDGNSLYLHDSEIAKIDKGELWISNAGWGSKTTYERLNGIPGVSINIKQGKTYLNGVPWDGSWINVGKINKMESRMNRKTNLKLETLNLLKKIIKEEVKRVLIKKDTIKEASLREKESDWEVPKGGHPQTFYIAYYSSTGEHGEAGTFRDFKSAYRSALTQMKGKNDEGESFLDGLEYVGVEATWKTIPEFAIMFVTKEYIRKISTNWFNSPEEAKIFKAAAEKCLQTGKPVIGKYPRRGSK